MGQDSRPSGMAAKDLPRTLWFFLDTDRWLYVRHLSVFLAGQSYELLPPLLIGMMVDVLIAYRPGQSLWPLAWLIIGLAVSSALVAILRLRSRRLLAQYGVSARYRAKVWGFERLMDHSLSWHQQEASGNKAQRVLTGAEAVREWCGVHNDLVPPLVAFVGTLIACAVLHPASVLFLFAYVAGLIAIELHFDRKAAALAQQVNLARENASGVFVEAAANVLAVKALGATGQLSARVESREAANRDLGHERARLHTTKWMWFQLHNAAAWALFLAGVSAAVLQGALSVGLVLTYTQYFNSLRTSTLSLADRFQLLVERFSELARMMPMFAAQGAISGELPFPQDWQRLQLESVTYLNDTARVDSGLVDVSLVIQRGERIGLVGQSGSGKSTLLRLLLGLCAPQSGRILLDGLPMQHIRHELLTANIAVVLQESELFKLSLRDNITLMRDVPRAVLDAACHVACLDELIARLPMGLDTPLGERGYALSGGERQRVGIARALCRPFSLLLLDEATSALDEATEITLMRRLYAALPLDASLLIVTHRSSNLAGVGRVIEMQGGRIAAPQVCE